MVKIISSDVIISSTGERICRIIDDVGAVQWTNVGGKLHNPDGAALTTQGGRYEYHINGKLHREDGPAIIKSGQDDQYWLNGIPITQADHQTATLHTLEPFIADNTTSFASWVKKGTNEFHNPIGPAHFGKYYIEGMEVTKEIHTGIKATYLATGILPKINGQDPVNWLVYRDQYGSLHRSDGPAVIHNNGSIEYYCYGKIHRIDGPAILYADGTQHYCLNGTKLNKDTWEKEIKLLELNKILDSTSLGSMSATIVKSKYSLEDIKFESVSMVPIAPVVHDEIIAKDNTIKSYGHMIAGDFITSLGVDKRLGNKIKVKINPSDIQKIAPIIPVKPTEQPKEIGFMGITGIVLAGTMIAGLISRPKKGFKGPQKAELAVPIEMAQEAYKQD